MSRTFTLNPAAAKRADQGGTRITEPGEYSGHIVAAYADKSRNTGTESFNLIFKSDEGQDITLTLYTHRADGSELPSCDAVHAIMTCTGQRALTPQPGTVEIYDFGSKDMVKVQRDVYPDLKDKPIGLLLRGEEYENNNGEVKTRLVIKGSFNPANRLMAGEILARATEPAALDRAVEWLKSNPVKKLKRSNAATYSNTAYASQAQYDAQGEAFADDDLDSIPF